MRETLAVVMYHQKTLEVVMHCQEKLTHRQKDFASRNITSELRKMFQSSYKPLKDASSYTPSGEVTYRQETLQVATHTWWLHTRASKYNLSALGTYFECEGVKRTYLNFT